MSRGLEAIANKGFVALLTPTSVACADRATATTRVNGLMKSSSVRGSGLSASKRSNRALISLASAIAGASRWTLQKKNVFTAIVAVLPGLKARARGQFQ